MCCWHTPITWNQYQTPKSKLTVGSAVPVMSLVSHENLDFHRRGRGRHQRPREPISLISGSESTFLNWKRRILSQKLTIRPTFSIGSAVLSEKLPTSRRFTLARSKVDMELTWDTVSLIRASRTRSEEHLVKRDGLQSSKLTPKQDQTAMSFRADEARNRR